MHAGVRVRKTVDKNVLITTEFIVQIEKILLKSGVRNNIERIEKKRLAQAKDWRSKQHGIARTLHLSARVRAIKKNISYKLNPEAIIAYLIFQNNRCILTGIEFDYEHDERYNFRPFAPSLDRIDNNKGYTYDNVQIVCVIVNKAKNEYPIDLFDQMCIERVRKLTNGQT